MDHELTAYAFGCTVAFLVGMSKTGLPGLAIPAVLLMTQAFSGNEKLSVGALLPVLLVGDLFALAFYRHHAQWARLWSLFPFVVVGMVPGVLVLTMVDHSRFKLVLGWLVLALLLLEVCRKQLAWNQLPGRWWFGGTMGGLAGFCTTVGNAAGPVMNIYLISLGMIKEQFMGTLAWFFFIVNASKAPLYYSMQMITVETLRFDLIIVPPIVLGALIGRRLLKIIPQRVFDPLVLILAGVAALKLIGVTPF